jgi:hypothetical protein
MRRALGLAVLSLGVAAALLPAAPASATCIQIDESSCYSLCPDLNPAYQGLDEQLGGALPDRDFACVD